MSNEVSAVVGRYIAVWNESDGDRRRNLISRTWSDDAEYVDPAFSGVGPAGIDHMVATVHERYPGHEFRLVGSVESHNDRLRFLWEMVSVSEGIPLVSGVDFGIVADDGRLKSITGFFDQVSAPQQSN